MLYINYIENGVSNNERFKLDSYLNRDNSNYPFFLLREYLLAKQFVLNTPDLNIHNEVSSELHMNVQDVGGKKPKFLLLLETPEVYLPNSNLSKILDYQHVFTWRQDLQLKNKSHINFPNTPNEIGFNDWKNRDKFACLIASGSKGLRLASTNDLYKQRIETIRWFEDHEPGDFDLYGGGWESKIAPTNNLSKVLRKTSIFISSLTGYKPYLSYKGRVDKKADLLQKYKFNICYENISCWPGYITEKIFDSFFSGCVPIYWGAPDIDRHVPKACFIDRRNFLSHEDLYGYMKSITPVQFAGFQEEIAIFLKSEKAKDFYAEKFAEIIAQEIHNFFHPNKLTADTSK